MPYSSTTKHALAQAMKELMRQHPFEKIRVADICSACGMNRKSFYYHFKDKYDLVNWIFYTEFLEPAQRAEYQNVTLFLRDLYIYFYREQKFYRCVLQIIGQNSFWEYFIETVSPILIGFSHDIFDDMDNVRFYGAFVGDVILASILRWLTGGAQIPPDQYLEQMWRILVGYARNILREFPRAAAGEPKAQ